MVLEVCLVKDVVYEACYVWYASFVCLWIRSVKCQVELEVREFFLNLCVVLKVECLFKATCTVEEVDFSVGLLCLEQVHDMRTHRGHTGTTANEHELLVIRTIVRNEELAVRT